jgi:hypothetical protein
MSFLGKDIAVGRPIREDHGQWTYQTTGIAFWRDAPVPWTLSLMDLTIRPLTAALWPAVEDLFGKAGASNGCWCMYWRIGPCYKERPREDNKRYLERLAASGPPPGLLAFDGEVPAGWCELAPLNVWNATPDP